MPTPATDNATAYRGDTIRERRQLLDANGNPYVLTGTTPAAQIRATSASADVLYELACTLEDGDTTVAMVTPAGVTDAAPDSAVWDWQLTFPLLEGQTVPDVRTFGAGTFTFSGQVTKAVTP